MSIRALTTLTLALAVLAPTAASAKRPTLNVLEKRQLPNYCWNREKVDPQTAGLPGYSIPAACGKRMNHLCNGHVYLVAAQRPSEKPRERRFYAQKAIGEFDYTMRHMPPACPLRANVEASIGFARILQQRKY